MADENNDDLDLKIAAIVHDAVSTNTQLSDLLKVAFANDTAAVFVIPKAMVRELVQAFSQSNSLIVELYTEYAAAMEELEKQAK